MAELRLCSTHDLAPSQIRQVPLEGRGPLAVYNLNGEFCVTDDTCTHGSASLAEGDITGEEVVCPFHLGAFNIRTGQPTMPPCAVPLRVYPVRVEDGAVIVEIDP